jgi:hypothetical protein
MLNLKVPDWESNELDGSCIPWTYAWIRDDLFTLFPKGLNAQQITTIQQIKKVCWAMRIETISPPPVNRNEQAAEHKGFLPANGGLFTFQSNATTRHLAANRVPSIHGQ